MNNGSQITDANFGVADVNLSSPSTNSTFKKMTSIVDISSMATSTTLKIQVSKNPNSVKSALEPTLKTVIKDYVGVDHPFKNPKRNDSRSKAGQHNLIHGLSQGNLSSSFPNKNTKLNLNLGKLQQKENDTVMPSCSNNTPNNSIRSKNICIEEDCVIAAATILSSLDRSHDPCENFYSYACGGWIKKAIEMSTDRFQMIDKRNRNLLRSILEKEDIPKHDKKKKILKTANEKTRYFYKSCVYNNALKDKENIKELMEVLLEAGGSSLANLQGSKTDHKLSLDQRLQKLHNHFGVNALFTWGVIDIQGDNKLAIINGGFNAGLLDDGFDKNVYLKVMNRLVNLLAEAKEDVVTVELDYDEEMTKAFNEEELSNSSTWVNVTYEYEEISEDYKSSYDYKESYDQKISPASVSAGAKFLDFLKKPIEWLVTASSVDDYATKPDSKIFNTSNETTTSDNGTTNVLELTTLPIFKEKPNPNSRDAEANKIKYSPGGNEHKPQDVLHVPHHSAALLSHYQNDLPL